MGGCRGYGLALLIALAACAAQKEGRQRLNTSAPDGCAPEVLEARPCFMPYTVAPILANREQVGRALVQHYPVSLRDKGVGGTVVVWFLVGETGVVRKVELSKSSGVSGLDEGALAVARVMRFTPARNGEATVPVWVQLPIVFRIS